MGITCTVNEIKKQGLHPDQSERKDQLRSLLFTFGDDIRRRVIRVVTNTRLGGPRRADSVREAVWPWHLARETVCVLRFATSNMIGRHRGVGKTIDLIKNAVHS